MFKRFVVTGATACAALMLSLTSLPAVAYQLDTKIGQVLSANSGDKTELGALMDFTGLTLTLDSKVDIGTAALNDGFTDQWYIDVAPATPGYFAIKFGIGNDNNNGNNKGNGGNGGNGGISVAADTFFFKNVFELDKLVFSNADVLGLALATAECNNCNIERISHYTIFSGRPNNVPEPLPLTLMAIGLAGMWLSRRRHSEAGNT